MPTDFDVVLELALIERRARENVRRKMASEQLGLAWVGLESLVVEGDEKRPS